MKTVSRQLRLFESEPQFASLSCLSDIHVIYKNDVRWVNCFCGKKVERSILPHVRQEHPDVWDGWRSVFVVLRNRKWSTKRIMNAFRANEKLLFTWSIIERELRKMEESGEAELSIWQKDRIETWNPKGFRRENTTVWNFPDRGDWAVHQSDYRGNWPPQLVRNLIMTYAHKGELVVDLFIGGGTTLIECYLTGRKSIGLDVSDFAIKTTTARLREMEEKARQEPKFRLNGSKPIVRKADSRRCGEAFKEIGISEGSIALICAHPPYLDALKYTESADGDLSHLKSVDEFVDAIRQVCVEAKRWLKPNGTFALLIGDVRKKNKLQPLGFLLLNAFLQSGYQLKEVIIKTQNQDQSTHLWTKNTDLKFLIAHEYLLLFSTR